MLECFFMLKSLLELWCVVMNNIPAEWWLMIEWLLGMIEKIAIVGGIVFGFTIFRQHRKQQRSEAAAELKGRFKGTINYSIEVAGKADLYQWDHTNEDLTINPKLSSQAFEQRPSNWIGNKVQKLKEESYVLLAKIGGQEAIRLERTIDELEKYCIGLSGAIYEKLNENKDHLKLSDVQDKLKNFRAHLQKLLSEAEAILDPIID